MDYIENYKDWIEQYKILEFLKRCKGEKTPVWQPTRWQGNPILDEYRTKAELGYSKDLYFFHQLNANSPEIKDFNFSFFNLPKERKNINWWFVILYPGEFQSIHIDPQLTEVKNPVRYTLFLEDWQPGHIFVYEDKILTNYKAGDLYEWSDPMTVHAPANIGYSTRYTLQITLFDD